MYWILPEIEIGQTPSNTGDTCHRELRNLSDKRKRRDFFVNSYRSSDIRICAHEDAIPGSDELLHEMFGE
jgi:hypothetical protein